MQKKFGNECPLYIKRDNDDPYTYVILAKLIYKDIVTKEDEEYYEVVFHVSQHGIEGVFGVVFESEPGELVPIKLELTYDHETGRDD